MSNRPTGITIKYLNDKPGYLRAYYEKNRDRLLADGKVRGAKWRVENRQYKRDRARQVCAERKAKIVELLCGNCIRCGFGDIRALQIDHINGCHLSRRDRIKSGEQGERLYTRLLKRGIDFTRYQLLCANCNWIKRVENGECRSSK